MEKKGEEIKTYCAHDRTEYFLYTMMQLKLLKIKVKMFVLINLAFNDRSAASSEKPLCVPFKFKKRFETLVKCSMSKYG